MPNNCRPDLYPLDVYCLPEITPPAPIESAVLGGLWEDFGDPDFPVSTAAVIRLRPAGRTTDECG